MGQRNFTDAEEAEIGKIYLAGHSAKAIMRAYGLRFHISICAALERQGITQRPAPERNRLYKLNAHAFDEITTQEQAYWLGYLYADGYVGRNRTLAVRLKRADAQHLFRLRDFLQSESPIKENVHYIGDKGYPQAHVEFTDQHLAARLQEIGIRVGRPDAQTMIDAIPEHLYRHWLRGQIDGDGCIMCPKPKHALIISLTSQEAMLIHVRRIIASHLGLNPNLAIRRVNNEQIFCLIYGGNICALAVASWIYKDATVFLPRKYEVVAPRLTFSCHQG